MQQEWDQGEDVPEMRDRPQIPDDLEPVLRAWQLLRKAKRDPADPIGAPQVLAYLDALCIMEPDLRAEYLELVILMDHAHRTHKHPE